MSHVHLVIDIDHTLACAFESTKALKSALVVNPHLHYFLENNLIIDALMPHLLHPGVIEFIQYIFKIPHISLSFFSSAFEERNVIFVRELLIRSLGVDYYNKVKDSVSVFSYKHLVLSSRCITKDQFSFFKLLKKMPIVSQYVIKQERYVEEEKKNLLVTLKKNETLENTLLIEDNPNYIYKGQEKNALITSGVYLEYCMMQNDSEIRQANHIFYIVGLLKKIREPSDFSFIDKLFHLQFKINNQNFYEERYDELYQMRPYYLDGLAELQKINPQLEFFGGKKAIKYFFEEEAIKQLSEFNLPSWFAHHGL